jgi:5-methylcytosine-specific restriction endonuclease McrA
MVKMHPDKIAEKILGREEKKRIPIPPRTRTDILTRPRKCMWCRKAPAQEIHHIDGNPRNNKRDNLIRLCGTCHNKEKRGEITKEQLRKRLGIKPKSQPKTKPRREPKPKTIESFGQQLVKRL